MAAINLCDRNFRHISHLNQKGREAHLFYRLVLPRPSPLAPLPLRERGTRKNILLPFSRFGFSKIKKWRSHFFIWYNYIMDQLDIKLNQVYAGRVVRKDLTKRLKEGASVPVYVLEYLLGMYCATDDDRAIEQGIQTVKKILAENYVRPDEAESVKSKIRERGRFTVIDRLTVKLNEKADIYQASFTNLGLKSVKVEPEIVTQNQKLLSGGIWCIVQMEYESGASPSPFLLASLKPIQMPNIDIQELLAGRNEFTRDEWIELLLRSAGLEPTTFS